MQSITFTPADREDSGTGSKVWSNAGDIYTSKYQLIRIVWNDNHFSEIPASANIDSVVISFTAKNNTTKSAQSVNIYLQNSNVTPENSQASSDLLGAFDTSFANSSVADQTITKTLSSSSTELEKFITWMNTNPMYMTLHAYSSNSPAMYYTSFSVTINYTATTPYIYNGTKWVPATPYVYNGSTWVQASASIYNNGWI